MANVGTNERTSKPERQRRKRGSAQLYRQRDGSYSARVSLTVDGERIRQMVPLDTANPIAARRKLRALQAGETKPGEAAAPLTVSDFADEWLASLGATSERTAHDERKRIALYWTDAIGNMPLADVRPGHIRVVLDELAQGLRTGPRGKPLSKASVRHARGTALRLFDAAWRDELLPDNPVAKVRTPKMRSEGKARAVLTDEELRTLLAHPAVDPEIKMLTLVSRTVGGMRTGDLLALDWSAFGPGDDGSPWRTCRVPRRKARGNGRGAQVLDVPEGMRPLLDAWWRAHGSPKVGPVFPVRRGKRAGQTRRPVSYATRLRRGLLRAGIDRHELHHETADTLAVDFHSTRRAYCTALAKANVAGSVAQVLSGHSDPKVHQRYIEAATIRALPDAAMLRLPAAQIGNAVAYLAAPPRKSPSESVPKPRVELGTRGVSERFRAVKRANPGEYRGNDHLVSIGFHFVAQELRAGTPAGFVVAGDVPPVVEIEQRQA